eukprot:Gb_01380 [translate_table: standard]
MQPTAPKAFLPLKSNQRSVQPNIAFKDIMWKCSDCAVPVCFKKQGIRADGHELGYSIRKRIGYVGYCFHTEDNSVQVSDNSCNDSRPSEGQWKGHLRKWCEWGWVIPIRASWRYVLWKLKAGFTKMINPRPQTTAAGRFKYDPLSYAQNFDNGCWQDEESHKFHCRISATSSAM